jgi:hypothetical protein
MSYFKEYKTRSGMKLGEIINTSEDLCRSEQMNKEWEAKIMNKIIWGHKDGFEATLPTIKTKEI